MSDSIVKREMLEAFRADWGRLRHQRAKLEKLQKMRQTLERLGLAGKHLELEECDAVDRASPDLSQCSTANPSSRQMTFRKLRL